MHFPIEALTDVDRHVFVEADASRTIRRMVIVQYETVQANSQFKFRYPPKPPALFGTHTYRYGAYVYDDARAAAGAPLKEAALTRAMLSARGYHLPRLLRVARLARVADSEGQSEVIIFYMENADADYPAGPLQGADEDGDLVLAPADKDAIFGRLENALQPLTGCCH